MPLDARQKRMVAYYCDLQQWQRAYSVAGNDQDAIVYIEQRKTRALAQLTAAWKERSEKQT